LQRYLATVLPTPEFHFFVLALTFMSAPPISLLAFPVAVHALYPALAFASARLGHTAAWRAVGGRLNGLALSKQVRAAPRPRPARTHARTRSTRSTRSTPSLPAGGLWGMVHGMGRV
jgi:hypothetical protein